MIDTSKNQICKACGEVFSTEKYFACPNHCNSYSIETNELTPEQIHKYNQERLKYIFCS